jgi:hypothetical protein
MKEMTKSIVTGKVPDNHFYSPYREAFDPQVNFQIKKLRKNSSVAICGASEHGQ